MTTKQKRVYLRLLSESAIVPGGHLFFTDEELHKESFRRSKALAREHHLKQPATPWPSNRASRYYRRPSRLGESLVWPANEQP